MGRLRFELRTNRLKAEEIGGKSLALQGLNYLQERIEKYVD